MSLADIERNKIFTIIQMFILARIGSGEVRCDCYDCFWCTGTQFIFGKLYPTISQVGYTWRWTVQKSCYSTWSGCSCLVHPSERCLARHPPSSKQLIDEASLTLRMKRGREGLNLGWSKKCQAKKAKKSLEISKKKTTS